MIGLYEEERIAYLQLVDSLIYCVSSVSSIHSVTLNFISWYVLDFKKRKFYKSIHIKVIDQLFDYDLI